MFDLFYKYLILHKKVAVPGVGLFSLNRQPAQLNFSDKEFVAPHYEVKLLQGGQVPEQNFYSFVAKENKVDDDEARRLVEEFASDIKQQFKTYKEINWQGIGLITENVFGEYNLEAENVLKTYFPDVYAERIESPAPAATTYEEPEPVVVEEPVTVEEEEEDETTVKKQDWWIDAIILAILAIAAIGYYYLKNGTLIH